MNIIKVNHLYLIVTFFFLFFLSVFSFAQSNMPIQWQMCYGGSEVDVVYDMVQTENGFLVIGDTKSSDGNVSFNNGSSDIWIINIDSMGALIWERAYGGSSLDYHGRIIADLEGDYYFVGAVGSNDGDIQSNNHGDFDTWVVKIDASGEIIWEKCYGGSGREEVPGIILLSDGNLLITTNSTSDDGDLPAHYGVYDAWLFVISPYGEIIKSAVFGNDLHNHIYDVVETQDGGYFFISEASSTNGMVEGNYHGGMTDVWAVKTDSDMNIEWQMLYGGSAYDDGTLGLIELNDGYIFTAYTASNDGDVSGFHGGFNDIWVVRIDLEGNIIWQRCLGGSNTEYVGDISQTEDGGFVVFGSTESDNGDVSGNHSYPNWGWFDIWMVNSAARVNWNGSNVMAALVMKRCLAV